MSDDKKKTTLDLVKSSQQKIEEIRGGPAYSSDFECATLLEELIKEIRLLAFETKSLKKLLSHNELYLSKKENKIEILRQEKNVLIERLVRCEKG